MRIAKSYTTRKPRFPGEDSYHFVSEEEFDKLDLCDKNQILWQFVRSDAG